MSVTERTDFIIGEEATLTKVVSLEDIQTFARISQDTNPLHLDREYAESTMFKGQIAHGMLVAGLISAVLGTMLPGPGAIYLNQTLQFTAPVYPGDTITAKVVVMSWDKGRGRISLKTEVFNQDVEVVVSGEAKLVMSAFLHRKPESN